MDVYMYAAALWCEDCGLKIREDLTASGEAPEDPDDEYTYDSDDFPKGPVSDGGGESDSPEHCDGCGCFLENPLTSDGEAYVIQAVKDARAKGRTDSVSLTEWEPYYDLDFGEEEEDEEECAHEDTYINDRMQTVCKECGEELGR